MAKNYDCNGDPCGEYGAAVREIERLSKELARLRITDEEREAVEASVRYWSGPFKPHPHAAVLRKLMERLK